MLDASNYIYMHCILAYILIYTLVSRVWKNHFHIICSWLCVDACTHGFSLYIALWSPAQSWFPLSEWIETRMLWRRRHHRKRKEVKYSFPFFVSPDMLVNYWRQNADEPDLFFFWTGWAWPDEILSQAKQVALPRRKREKARRNKLIKPLLLVVIHRMVI